MSCLVFKVPHETARLLGEVEVPGEKVSVDSSHVTVLYLGSDTPIETLAKAMTTAFKVCETTQPFTLRTSVVTCFPAGDDGVPVVARVESDPLMSFRAKIKTAFQAAGISFSDRHPVYRPHVTLSYASETITDHALLPLEWGAHELTLWGGDDGDRRLYVTIPLSLSMPKLARRVADRYLGR